MSPPTTIPLVCIVGDYILLVTTFAIAGKLFRHNRVSRDPFVGCDEVPQNIEVLPKIQQNTFYNCD